MKKKVLPVLFAALVIAQIVSLIKINDLQSQISSVRIAIDNTGSNTRNEISAIYTNVDSMLKKEASLIEIASIEVGTLDKGKLTVPITFSITPKEVSELTTVSLDIEGNIITMDKNGTTFSASASLDIFGNATPLILIDENGVKKTTQDDRIMIWSMKDSLLPSLHPRLMGQSTYGGGNYKVNKTLQADVKNAESDIVFEDMQFIITVDGEVISTETIPADILPSDWKINRSIPLRDGQVCVMTISAIDSIGLEHRYTVDHFAGGAKAQREPWFDDEEIYSADGNLIWKLEYKY